MKPDAQFSIFVGTQGLGKLLVANKYEVWLCIEDDMCATAQDSFCFVFDEETQQFVRNIPPLTLHLT